MLLNDFLTTLSQQKGDRLSVYQDNIRLASLASVLDKEVKELICETINSIGYDQDGKTYTCDNNIHIKVFLKN